MSRTKESKEIGDNAIVWIREDGKLMITLTLKDLLKLVNGLN